MQLLGTDAYLGSKSELRPVGKRGRRIGIYAGGIHQLQELFGCIGVLGNDTLAMSRTETGDMGQRLVQRIHRLHGHFVIHKLSAEMFLRSRLQQIRRIMPL